MKNNSLVQYMQVFLISTWAPCLLYQENIHVLQFGNLLSELVNVWGLAMLLICIFSCATKSVSKGCLLSTIFVLWFFAYGDALDT